MMTTATTPAMATARGVGVRPPVEPSRAGRRPPRSSFYQRDIGLDTALSHLITKQEHRYILTEVKVQTEGRARSATVRLVPSEIARRNGMEPNNVGRAIRGLAGLGVLIHIEGPVYAFVEDWRSWKVGEALAEQKRYIDDVTRRANAGHQVAAPAPQPEHASPLFVQGFFFDPTGAPERGAERPKERVAAGSARGPSPIPGPPEMQSPGTAKAIPGDGIEQSGRTVSPAAPIEEPARRQIQSREAEGGGSPHPLSTSPRSVPRSQPPGPGRGPTVPGGAIGPAIDPGDRAELDRVASQCREWFPARPEIARAVAERQGAFPVAWYGEVAAKLRSKPSDLHKPGYFLGILRNFDPAEAARAGPGAASAPFYPKIQFSPEQIANRSVRAARRARLGPQAPSPSHAPARSISP